MLYFSQLILTTTVYNYYTYNNYIVPTGLIKQQMSIDCQRVSEHLLLIVFLHRDGDLLDLVDGEVGGVAEGSDDGLRVKTLLHIRLQLLQELCSQESDGGGAISDLSVKENKNYMKTSRDPSVSDVMIETDVHRLHSNRNGIKT